MYRMPINNKNLRSTFRMMAWFSSCVKLVRKAYRLSISFSLDGGDGVPASLTTVAASFLGSMSMVAVGNMDCRKVSNGNGECLMLTSARYVGIPEHRFQGSTVND